MAMIHNVRSRQLSPMGNTDSFYNQPPAVPSTTSAPHYGFYRQHSPHMHPAPHISNAVPQSYYPSREMEFFGTSTANDYRLYPPSPPTQEMPLVAPTAAAAPPPPVPAMPSQYPYSSNYMRTAPSPQEFPQHMDALPRLTAPVHGGAGVGAAPMAQANFTRLPSPYGHHRDLHPATQRRASSTLPGIRKTAKRAHSCMVCGKVFARPSALQTHLYSHTGEKPFKCEHTGCGRSFSVVSNLRRHARVHKD